MLASHMGGKTTAARHWALHKQAEWVNSTHIRIAYEKALQNKGCYFVIDDIDETVADDNYHQNVFRLLNVPDTVVIMTACSLGFTEKIIHRDLKSRLQSLPTLTIPPPDQALVNQLLVIKCGQLGIDLPVKYLDYIFARIPRNFQSIIRFAKGLDYAMLTESRKLGLRLIADVLAQLRHETDASVKHEV